MCNHLDFNNSRDDMSEDISEWKQLVAKCDIAVDDARRGASSTAKEPFELLLSVDRGLHGINLKTGRERGIILQWA
jgi:hypothetical protein